LAAHYVQEVALSQSGYRRGGSLLCGQETFAGLNNNLQLSIYEWHAHPAGEAHERDARVTFRWAGLSN